MDTSKWFDPRLTVGEIKAHYRQLAMDHHPDLHPELGQVPMQEINAAYHAALLARDGETSIGSDQKEHIYRYNQATESEMVAKFYAAVAARMGGVTLEIIGTWLWATGDTRPHKDTLKAMGFWWNAKRACWQWHVGQYHSRRSPLSTDALRRVYGVYARADSDSAAGSMVPA